VDLIRLRVKQGALEGIARLKRKLQICGALRVDLNNAGEE